MKGVSMAGFGGDLLSVRFGTEEFASAECKTMGAVRPISRGSSRTI